MHSATIIGNLGGNAELRNENGKSFVTFRVADTQRSVDAEGVVHESTSWVSCLLNGENKGLLPYLIKGQKVCVIGDATVRTYHSKTQHALVAGVNLFVRQIELIGAKPDNVPGFLFDNQGREVRVGKYYYAAEVRDTTLFDKSNKEYTVDAQGWVTPSTANAGTETDTATVQKEDVQVFDGQGYETVEDAAEASAQSVTEPAKKSNSKSK